MTSWLAPVLAFRPFLQPLPVWGVWAALILPLCVGIATVWKSIKCARMADVPREVAVQLMWVLGGFAAGAAVLVGVIKLAGL